MNNMKRSSSNSSSSTNNTTSKKSYNSTDDDVKEAVLEISKAFTNTTSSSSHSPTIKKNTSSKRNSISIKRRSSILGSSRRSSISSNTRRSISNNDPNINATKIQKVIRGYLTRGILLNNDRIRLIRLLRDWGYGKVSTLQERKEVQDYNTQGLVRFAAILSSTPSRPIKNLPSKDKIKGYINSILMKQKELDNKHIIMKENYLSEHNERELMRHEDSRMRFIYCYEHIIEDHDDRLQRERKEKQKREKDYRLRRQQWQMLQYATDKTNVEEGMRKMERELMFIEDMRMTKIRKLLEEAKINALENERIRMIKEDMTMRSIHQELSIIEERLQIYKYEADKVDRARREGRLLYGPLAKRYGSSINQRVNRMMMSNQYYGYERYDLNITNSNYTPDSTFYKTNNSFNMYGDTYTNRGLNSTMGTSYDNYIDDDNDNMKPHVFTSLTLALPVVVKLSDKYVERKVKLLAMLQSFDFFATIPYVNYTSSNDSQESILPILSSNTTTSSNNNIPNIQQLRYSFKCNILPHLSCRVNFYKVSSLKKIRLLRVDAFKRLVLLTADFVHKHQILTKMR